MNLDVLKLKFFLNENERIEIIEKLLEINKNEPILDYEKSSISPGSFLNFNYLCKKYNIDLSKNYLNNLKISSLIYIKKISKRIILNYQNI